MIEDKSAKEQDQEKYRKKYAALVEKHNRVLGRLDAINKEKRKRLAVIKQIDMSMVAFKKINEKLNGFNPKLWTMLIEKAIVKRNKTIESFYYSDYQNTVEIK